MITQEQLQQRLWYSPDVGIFMWLVGRRRGKLAGKINKNGYIQIKIDGIWYYAHELAWFYVYGCWVKNLDHSNTIRWDNKLDNLRKASRSQQRMNSVNSVRNNTGQRGVSYCKLTGTYRARITINRRCFELGRYATLEAATSVYEAEAVRLFGEFKHGQTS